MLEINRILNGSASRQTLKTTRTAQGGSFQSQMESRMAMQPLRDRFTISNIVPEEKTEHLATGTSSQVVETKKPVIRPEDAVTIYTSDSTEVKLEKLRKMSEVSDYSDMSYEDIYTTIWNRYNTAFGGKMAAITSRIGPMSFAWCDIDYQFNQETRRCVITPLTRSLEAQGLIVSDKYSEEANQIISDVTSAPFGYSGMNFEEKEAAIFEKYNGRNSYMDFLSMQGELFKTGVYTNKLGAEGSWQLMSHMSDEALYHFFPAQMNKAGLLPEIWRGVPEEYLMSESKHETLLDLKFDIRSFYRGMRDTLQNIIVESSTFDIKGMIEKCINESESMLMKHWGKQDS